jgi:uncharacterized protein (DUF305 family)
MPMKVLIVPLIGLTLVSAVPVVAGSADPAFTTGAGAAMITMMNRMDVKPSGDVDIDFVAMMVPHHQGAIDMAELELRYGRNLRLKRIAQEIVVTQQEEITAMRLSVGQALPQAETPAGRPIVRDRKP